MKWRGRETSSNVDDMRSVKSSAGLNLGTLIPIIQFLIKTKFGRIILGIGVVAFFLGYNPLNLLNFASGGAASGGSKQLTQKDIDDANFSSVVLRDTEKIWGSIFAQYNATYQEPRLSLFSGAIQSGCGYASSQVGPFYCPADRKVYLDTSFFQELAKTHNAPGEFAQGYVIAHEVGHHIQNLIGVIENSTAQKKGKTEAQQNAIQVKVELQADCFAGIWAHYLEKQGGIIEDGDIEAALNAASMIGDDTLQKKARGYVVPDSFTHGSSAERKEWFYKGYKYGTLQACRNGLEG